MASFKRDDTDDESEDQELEAHYMYMAQLQEVTPDQVDNSGPIFDDEPIHKGKNADKEIELTLEQSQQGVSTDVLVSIEGVEELKRNVMDKRSYALSWKPCQGDSLNLPDHRIRRRCCSLIPAKSDS
ncbi:hypothetical protein Tco_1467205 [Tanacetum coccineum]